MGLKLANRNALTSTKSCSNRTIVGLKHVTDEPSEKLCPRSNRTIVGLKLVISNTFTVRTLRQQSHHCGIETSTFFHGKFPQSLQQSHHCGIETLKVALIEAKLAGQQSHHCGIETDESPQRLSLSLTRSNRTIVGLKLGLCPRQQFYSIKQQSHHCGIETKGMGVHSCHFFSSSNRTIVGLKQNCLGHLA